MAMSAVTVLRFAARVALAAALVFTAWLKLAPTGRSAVAARSWMAELGGGWVLTAVAVAELVAGLALLSSAWRPAARVVFWVLCGYAVILMGVVLAGKPVTNCGCFGAWHAPVSAHVSMLVGLLILARGVGYSTESTREIQAARTGRPEATEDVPISRH